ncbi:hypothetical protein INQ51_13910 [Maribellus sp. CM-23]|uniref:hypothetical protein n=1 Tax=Maribellus sp. CM-23 TaxID=2781026 RepID=UPI001F325EF6|nr:hypothetical protein [Maribellus sp. CM-23]MCE4565409.1 hypothetical protein [Maribellus sp. CM-23]
MGTWKNIAILTPIIITAGLLKYIIYYAFFHVPIVQFIELNEIIVLFSEDIIHILGLFILLGFISFLGSTTKTKMKTLRFQIKYYKEPEIEIRIWKYLRLNYVNIIILLGLAIFIWTNISHKQELKITTQILIAIDTIFFVIRFIVLELKRELFLKNKLEKKNQKIETFFGIFILALNLILIFSVNEFDNVKYDGKYSHVVITLNDETLKSDSTSFYIGKTKNFVFYYNTDSNTTRVIPCSRVLEMEFGRKILPETQIIKEHDNKDSTEINNENKIDINDTVNNKNTVPNN